MGTRHILCNWGWGTVIATLVAALASSYDIVYATALASQAANLVDCQIFDYLDKDDFLQIISGLYY